METIYIKEVKKEKRFPLNLFLRKKIFTENGFYILEVPKIKRKRGYIRLCKFLKKSGVKHVCFDSLEDKILEYYMKQTFHHINGENAFEFLFPSVIEFFAKKKGMELKNSHIFFISNHPKKVERFMSSIYRKVKSISVYTGSAEQFEPLSQTCREEYGMFLAVKGKDDRVKKYNHLYINIDNERIFKEDFFQGSSCLDIYRLYKGVYHMVSVYFKTPFDSFLKTHNIRKNLSLTEYFMQNSGNFSKKDYKIVNIIKL